MRIDATTREWMRDAGDEKAAREGARIDPYRIEHVFDFLETHLRLYEGDCAGQPFTPHDWQVEFFARLFGWVVWSERWQRWVRRFRTASVWVPKKNKKSPTLAATALYLLVADGEPGQKVYLAAKDGNQAKEIAGAHAIAMCEASPVLSAACEIAKSECKITHLASRSILKPISSGDERRQAAKEGLNGSVLIDETHVVDEKFAARVRRAGISRSEPLFCEFSTAGLDSDCYGHKRFEYAEQIIAGKVYDAHTLAMVYAAPQNTELAKIDAAELDRLGRLANPAWGHTIDPVEFRADFAEHARTPQTLADFGTYRLNMWQRAGVTWLDGEAWDACGADYTLDDLGPGGRIGGDAGLPAWGGLDLAKTRDSSALVLVFREDGESGDLEDAVFWSWPLLWLPRGRAEQLARDVPWLQWAEAGFVELTDGDVMDYRAIRTAAGDLAALAEIRELAYDKTYAEQVTQEIEDEHGVERVEFPQSMVWFARPTAEFEKAVISGRFRHPRQPAFSWQASHCKTRRDQDGNKRPVRPKDGDPRTVDSVLACVMAFARAIAGDEPEGGFFYNDHDVEVL